MSWNMVAIKSLGNVYTGKTPSKTVPEYFDGDIPFITPSELNNDIYVNNAHQKITELGAKQVTLIPKNSVMVCCIGSLGKVGIAGKELATNQQINSIVFDESQVFPKYGYYACARLKPILEKLAPATTVKIVNKSRFEALEIPLPPLPEQKRIAAILDKADAIRRKRQQAIQLADQFLRSVFLDMFGDPVTNSMGWEVVEVGSVVDCIVPGRDKPKSFTGDIPWITTNNLCHLGFTYEAEEFIGLTNAEINEVKAKIVPKGSVLMTCVGDLGVLSISGKDMVINQQLHAFLASQKINNIFLMYALSFQKKFMLKMASSTTVPYMNKTVCNSVPLIIPPVKNQNKFAEIYEKTHLQLIKMTQSEANVDNLFNSLSQKAFAGEL